VRLFNSANHCFLLLSSCELQSAPLLHPAPSGDNFYPPTFYGLSITAWGNSESPDSIIGPTIGY
jgi:hypothetical protein